MKKVLTTLIQFYRKRISPQTRARCRFVPTCSAYALTAINTHGALKGTCLTLWRLIRCNPFTKGGYDPVPGTDDNSAGNHEK